MAKFVCVSGHNSGDQFALAEGRNVVGRSPECDIVLFDRRISRIHCTVVCHESAHYIEDGGSRHGTYVNGKRIKEEAILNPGDKVKVGHTSFLFTGRSIVEGGEDQACAGGGEPSDQDLRHLLEETEVEVVANDDPLFDVEPTKFGFIKTLLGKGR